MVASPVFGLNHTATTISSMESPLVKSSNSSTIYLVSGDKKYAADDPGVLSDFGILGPARIVSEEFLSKTPSAGSLSRVIGSTADSSIYLIIAGIRLNFGSCEMVNEFGYSCEGLIKLPPEQLARFYGGPWVTRFIKSNTSATVYFMIDGEKRPIASWGDLIGLGVPFIINVLTEAFVNSLPQGDILFGGGGLIKTADSATVYAVNNWGNPASLFPVVSFSDTVALGLGTGVRTVDRRQLAKYSVGSVLKTMMKCGVNTYIADNGVLYRVDPSMYGHYNLNLSSFLEGGSICNRFNFSRAPLTNYVLNRGTVYYVENGLKKGFTSYRAFLEHGGVLGTTITVNDSFVDRLPSGAALNASAPKGEIEITNDLYNRANAERAARGLSPLGWNSYLNTNARNWSVQMANSNSFAHSNLYPLLNYFYVAAENIGLAGSGARSGAIHTAWMNSTGHRVNLLGRNLDVVGIGVYCAPNGKMWVTQQFGRWPNSALPTTFGPTPSVNPIVSGDGGGATC